MTKRESIVSGVLKYSVSTWVNIIIGFISVIFTTHLLNPTEYGYMSIFFSASTVLMYIICLGFDGAYIRFYNEPPGGNNSKELLYKLIIYLLIVGIPTALIATFGYGEMISNIIFGINSRKIIGILFIYTICQALLRYLNISYRMSFNVKAYTIQSVLINCLTRILIIFAAFFTSKFLDISYILTGGILITLIIYLYIQRYDFVPIGRNGIINWSIDLKGYSEYMKYAFYTAPATIVFYGNQYVNQQIIVDKTDAFYLGLFASAGMFGTILSGVKGGFSTFWLAFVFKNYNKEQNKIIDMHDYVVIASIVLASLMIIFRDFLYLFIGKEFHDSKIFYSILLIQPLLLFIMETTDKGLHIAKMNRMILWSNLLSVALNIILCYILTRYFGIVGAAYANAISALCLFTLCTYLAQKYYISIKNQVKTIAGIVIMVILLIVPSIDQNIVFLIVFTIVMNIFCWILYRREYIQLKNSCMVWLKNCIARLP